MSATVGHLDAKPKLLAIPKSANKSVAVADTNLAAWKLEHDVGAVIERASSVGKDIFESFDRKLVSPNVANTKVATELSQEVPRL
jgi:hypothetical protein